MSAGRISLFSGADLHLVYLDPEGFAHRHVRTPDKIWSAKKTLPRTDQAPFQAVKLVPGPGASVMLIGLDTAGRLSCLEIDETGDLGDDHIRLPNRAGIAFASFDAVWTGHDGIVVVAVSKDDVAYTQTTLDGVNWSQPGWSSQPRSPYPYPSDPYGVSESYEAPFPPTFKTVAIGCAWSGDAPVIAGLAPGPHENLPLILYADTNGNWQWADVPSIEETTYHRGSGKQITIKSPPYQAIVSDLYFGPVLLLLGGDGNIYCNTPTDGLLRHWTHDGEPLPNPDGLFFTKAMVAAGYPANRNHVRPLQAIAVSKLDQVPCLIWRDAAETHPARSAWHWAGPLPAPFPIKKVADFDIAAGADSLQVAYLATDGTVFLNDQDQQGAWHVHGPLR